MKISMNQIKKALILFCLPISLMANAQTPTALHKKHYNLAETGVAIEGYDPVAYQTAGKAIKGRQEFNLATEGITYYFANAKDRDLFKSDPEKYQPQFGGWCAYAMGAAGKKVPVDPETFKVTDGKLYLFYNKYFNNTKKSWDKDEANLKGKANVNWANFIKS